MEKERQLQPRVGYRSNRSRVFEIYGIKCTDPNYNCHHIVTKKDKKTNVVPNDFPLNDISNLYPIDKREHKLITTIIEKLDNRQNIDTHAEIEKGMKLISEKSEIISRKTVNIDNSVQVKPKKEKNWKNEETREYMLFCLKEEELDKEMLEYCCSIRLDLVTI